MEGRSLTTRCFIALDMPASARKSLEYVMEPLKNSGADVKWVEPANLHLTLKFLGGVRQERFPDIHSFLDSLAPALEPYRVRLSGVGAFPNPRKPKIVWAGMDEGSKETAALFAEIEAGLTRLGFPAEERAFSPHWTLGRVRGPRHLKDLCRTLEHIPAVPAAHFVIDRFTLYKSTLTSKGPVYEPLQKVDFKKRNAS